MIVNCCVPKLDSLKQITYYDDIMWNICHWFSWNYERFKLIPLILPEKMIKMWGRVIEKEEEGVDLKYSKKISRISRGPGGRVIQY